MNRSLHPWYYSALTFAAAMLASSVMLGGTLGIAYVASARTTASVDHRPVLAYHAHESGLAAATVIGPAASL